VNLTPDPCDSGTGVLPITNCGLHLADYPFQIIHRLGRVNQRVSGLAGLIRRRRGQPRVRPDGQQDHRCDRESGRIPACHCYPAVIDEFRQSGCRGDRERCHHVDDYPRAERCSDERVYDYAETTPDG
jgi:hypothetical protein